MDIIRGHVNPSHMRPVHIGACSNHKAKHDYIFESCLTLVPVRHVSVGLGHVCIYLSRISHGHQMRVHVTCRQSKPCYIYVHVCTCILKELTLCMLKRVADFIRKGPGVWYETLADGTIIFHDSLEDSKERGPSHLRSFR